MIDFLKIRLDASHSKFLLSNPLLDFTGEYSRETGEVFSFPLTAKYRNLEFIIKSSEYILLQGSIHKYAQNGRNYDDFGMNEMIQILIEICEKFGIDPLRANIINIEYGVNLRELPFESSHLLNIVLRYRTTSFNRMRNNRGLTVAGKDCYLNQFGIKLYDKAKQFKLDHQVFRYEVKVKKMEHLHKKKILIHSLFDLFIKKNLDMLGADLQAIWEEILMFDDNLYELDLKPSERSRLKDYRSLCYWEELYEDDVKNHNYHRHRYRDMLKRLPNPNQKMISSLVSRKWCELSQISQKDLVILTNFVNSQFSHIDHSSSESFWLNKLSKYFDDSVLEDLLTNVHRRCKITGLDISDQQEGSKFLSAKKIGERNAKSLRNRDSNRRNKLRNRVQKYHGQNMLFDMNEFLRFTEEQKKLMKSWSRLAN